MEHQKGDKIRVLSGPSAGERGVILSLSGDSARVRLGTDEMISLTLSELQNYSLAARRAWRTRPKKAGRPPATRATRKKMVSIRIDRQVWERLEMAVDQGLIPSREQAVNDWLAQKVVELGLDLEAETPS